MAVWFEECLEPFVDVKDYRLFLDSSTAHVKSFETIPWDGKAILIPKKCTIAL